MTQDAGLTRVINRTALIENILNQVIESFFEPRADTSLFFWATVLDTSVMQLGAKVKIAMAISHKMNVKLDNALHQVVALRNAFAHHPTESHPVLRVGKEPEEDRMDYTLHILNTSGKIKEEPRDVALSKFDEHFETAKASLVALRDAIRESRAGHSREAEL